MTKEDIIAWAREAGWPDSLVAPIIMDKLAEFAALIASRVAAAEREKSLRLWMLLDDVDTADDIAKSDDAVYRSLCHQAHQKRWAVMTGNEVDAAIRARGQK